MPFKTLKPNAVCRHKSERMSMYFHSFNAKIVCVDSFIEQFSIISIGSIHAAMSSIQNVLWAAKLQSIKLTDNSKFKTDFSSLFFLGLFLIRKYVR